MDSLDIPTDSLDIQDDIAARIVELANELVEENPDADRWDIADGILSGAVHWWLFANAPCGDPSCENCAEARPGCQSLRSPAWIPRNPIGSSTSSSMTGTRIPRC